MLCNVILVPIMWEANVWVTGPALGALASAGPPCAAKSAPTFLLSCLDRILTYPCVQAVSLLVESVVLSLLDVEAESAALDLLPAA